MTTKGIKIGVGILLVAGAMAFTAFLIHISKPRIVARAVAPNGIEFCVVQHCNWNLEFFTTGCYYRKPGGPWGWFYYDHEDSYWGRGEAVVDSTSNEIKIYRRGQLRVSFGWQDEHFQLFRPDFPYREFFGAQDWKTPGWHFSDLK